MARGTAQPRRATRVASVVELVGPAAAGKTSLRQALDRHFGASWLPPRLSWPSLLPAAVSLAPTVVATHWPYRGVLWKESKRMLFVEALRRALDRGVPERGLWVLDEGAVYMLARLQVFGGDRLESAAFRRWWANAIEKWSSVLTMIVRLDAPDNVLIHRLRGRTQPHPVRDHGDDAIIRFLSDYRRAYDRVIDGLAAANPALRVWTYQSDVLSQSRIVEEVASCLELPGGGR